MRFPAPAIDATGRSMSRNGPKSVALGCESLVFSGSEMPRDSARFIAHRLRASQLGKITLASPSSHRLSYICPHLEGPTTKTMYVTAHGTFNGTSWEELCQLVFKRKHSAEGYQHIPVSPGDYGLEGFTSLTGYGFQCYCPEKAYSRKELYEKQRDKITEDLKKLKDNETDLLEILGDTRIENWIFVTPDLASHALHRHARKKELEVKSWGLTITHPQFRIRLHDAEHYLVEIKQIQSAKGSALDFNTDVPELEALNGPPEKYEANLLRKCEARLEPKKTLPSHERLVSSLYGSTLRNFMEADSYLRRIEESAPVLHFRLIRLINEFEISVKEKAITWVGSAEELTNQVSTGLAARILKDLHPEFNETSASQVARHVVARWMAICQLDYD